MRGAANEKRQPWLRYSGHADTRSRGVGEEQKKRGAIKFGLIKLQLKRRKNGKKNKEKAKKMNKHQHLIVCQARERERKGAGESVRVTGSDCARERD